jgi:hypothetical protein
VTGEGAVRMSAAKGTGVRIPPGVPVFPFEVKAVRAQIAVAETRFVIDCESIAPNCDRGMYNSFAGLSPNSSKRSSAGWSHCVRHIVRPSLYFGLPLAICDCDAVGFHGTRPGTRALGKTPLLP